MSYNIAICIPPVPTDDDEAWKAVDGLIEAKGPAPRLFKLLHDQLTSKYPCVVLGAPSMRAQASDNREILWVVQFQL
jgi:hypothetical protein